MLPKTPFFLTLTCTEAEGLKDRLYEKINELERQSATLNKQDGTARDVLLRTQAARRALQAGQASTNPYA